MADSLQSLGNIQDASRILELRDKRLGKEDTKVYKLNNIDIKEAQAALQQAVGDNYDSKQVGELARRIGQVRLDNPYVDPYVVSDAIIAAGTVTEDGRWWGSNTDFNADRLMPDALSAQAAPTGNTTSSGVNYSTTLE